MDPDKVLEEILELAAVKASSDDDSEELGYLIMALDQWLRLGGFLPARWRGSAKGKGAAEAARAAYERALRVRSGGTS